ncbi:MAG: UDP-N-acetylglucosamine 2-epimerase, partial [Gammaproteobacteria bacterium]|nr:UDP-N-acetylglucosamine 2-epimerase [Gammaproteobacteria bacterium]MBU1554120.1 UDP-N-acetylglucosamine 2-epimerase [Gammaproteobacteria bacterium]
VPTVNIGSRQQGRLAAASVLHCRADTAAIQHGIATAVNSTADFASNPYGQGNTSGKIIQLIKQLQFDPVKPFYELPGAAL